MKKRLLPVLLLLLLSSAGFAQTYTLKVTVPDSTNVCYASGDFNGWKQPGTLMTLASSGPKVFTLDVEVADTTNSTYKFCAGPDWKYQQNQADNFRISKLTPAGETVDGFQAYYNEGMAKDVTFDVLVPDSLFQVYLTGSYNGWSGTMDQMTLADSSVNGKEFTLTIHIQDTTTLEYKFSAGPGWAYQQTAGNYKYMTDGSTVVCDNFTAIYNPSLVGDITVNITVPDLTVEVWLAGSYNGWSWSDAIQATKNDDGTYTAVIPQVQNVEFKVWCYNDWPYEEAIDSLGNGLPSNRTATFLANPVIDITVPYWKKLYNPEVRNFKVTVPDTVTVVYVAGGFNGWSPSATKMTKVSDGPKVFTYSTLIADADTAGSEYRFCAGPDWKYEMKQAANFKISAMISAGDVVDTFKAIYNVGMAKTVTIDVLVPAEVVELNLTGSFNGWDPTANPMDFIDSTVNGKEYSLTFFTLDTTTLEYKFVAGPGWSYQQVAGNYKYITDGGTVVCDAFQNIFNPALIGDVTVTITVPEGTPDVYLIGSFSDPNWSLDGAIHATKNLDGTYTAVIPGIQTCEFKCWNYPDWPYEEALDTTGASLPSNRVATFATDPSISITVNAWKQVYTSVQKIIPVSYHIYSNSGSVIVDGVRSGVTIYDLMGRMMENVNTRGSFISRSLKSGIYIVRVDNVTQKIYVW